MNDRMGSRRSTLPVERCYAASHNADQRGFYSLSELEQRGWTCHMIRTLLKPDRWRKNMLRRTRRRGRKDMYSQCSPLEYEYSREQVTATEATEKWQKAKARADRKVKRTVSRGNPSVPGPRLDNKPSDPRFSTLSFLTPSPTGKELIANSPPVSPKTDSTEGRLDERMRQRFKKIDRVLAKETARPPRGGQSQ